MYLESVNGNYYNWIGGLVTPILDGGKKRVFCAREFWHLSAVFDKEHRLSEQVKYQAGHGDLDLIIINFKLKVHFANFVIVY